MDKRNISQSQTHVISLGYLNETSQSLTRFPPPQQIRLTENIKPNYPRENWLKIIEAKYTEVRDLVNKGTFRDVLRAEPLDGVNLITTRYALAVKPNKDKEERYKERYVAGGNLDTMSDYLA